MGWIDLNSSFSGQGFIFGQDKFHLQVNASKQLEVQLNGNTLTYNTVALETARWYHVGAIYDGNILKLYLNGVMVASTSASGNISSDISALTIGKDAIADSNYFKGKIDELRLFDIALTDQQLQRMVYQEIENNSSEVRGVIIPKNIGSLPYSNLRRYYRMDAYKDDIIDDLTTSGIDNGIGMRIYNNKVIAIQEAPMPFVTEQEGNFAVAVDNQAIDVRGLDVMDQDWSIVQVKHNITETANNVDLGMFVDPNIKITMNNDTKIQNDWYLQLDGKIDLQGKSQLVQTAESDLDVASTGTIERDQQGQASKFNYNYWSSPVGFTNTTTNNNPFTVNGVMRDATDPANPLNLNWTSGYDSSATTPLTMSTYWIFKFQNLTPVYANWTYAGPNGSLLAAQGYTMKGSNTEGSTQNYTFVGKPNNGAISSPIAANNANLSGNPYASAIDANAFITDNLASTTGTVYFWEHFPTNASHILQEYQGGYAARNLIGGIPPVSPAGISGLGSSTRIPGRYIPVGQGFLLYGSASGGTINFDNSQRAFIKEDHADSNILFKQGNAAANAVRVSNQEDVIQNPAEEFSKIRLGFNSANGFHRQLLLGFMNEFATAGFDPGYDAVQIDNQPNDMYFVVEEFRLVIQGDGYFNADNIYPLGVKTAVDGTISFTLDGTENFSPDQAIFIYDNVTGLYHDIRSESFQVEMPVGLNFERFSLRFKNNLLADTTFAANDINIRFANNDNLLTIQNTGTETVQSVELFNMLGQSIQTWLVEKGDQKLIRIHAENLSTGSYIFKVHTTNGDRAEKVIIR